MTISIPTLPPDSAATVAIPGETEIVPAISTDGFAQIMLAQAPVIGCEAPVETLEDVPVQTAPNEQAAVLAASLLWAPIPMLAETPAPSLELGLDCGSAEKVLPEGDYTKKQSSEGLGEAKSVEI